MLNIPGYVSKFALAVAMQAACIAAHASPIVVDFSFANTDPYGVSGSVGGVLDFAAAGTDVAATGVYVTSLPSGYFSPYSSTTNFLVASELVFANAFDVSATGQVTAATLGIRTNASSSYLNLDYGVNNEFDCLNRGFLYNDGGFGGITFTAVDGTSVPEPGTFPISLSATATLLLIQRRKRQTI